METIDLVVRVGMMLVICIALPVALYGIYLELRR